MNESELSLYSQNEKEETSLIVKVSLEKIAMLVAGEIDEKIQPNKSGHIIQVGSSALIMFQSVEDQEGSGSKTFHVSLKDYAVSMNPQFKATSTSHASPLIGPTQMEFRSVNTTENSGVVVSREVSVSCDALKASLLAHDVILISEVMEQHLNELKKFESRSDLERKNSSLMVSPGKGSSIATTLKFQLHPFSIILMRKNHIEAKTETYPLFELRGEAYGKLEGCTNALFGDSRADIKMCYYNKETTDWDDIVEPIALTIEFEQQPNDFVSTYVIDLHFDM